MVEVFKTDVQYTGQAARIVKELSVRLPGHKINFDLDDCDRILRIEGDSVHPEAVITWLQTWRCNCTVLE